MRRVASRRRARLGSVVGLLLVPLAACGGGGAGGGAAGGGAAGRDEPTAAELTAEADAAIEIVPSTPPLPPPTAGPLTPRQMPPPTAFGAGWVTGVDAEALVAGESAAPAPTQQRDVDELIEGLTPVGCPEAAVEIALPRPTWALEGSYVGPAGAPGVSLVLEFAEAAAAVAFLDGLAGQAQACPPAPSPPAEDDPPLLSFSAVARSADQVSALRQEHGFEADPNRYLLVVTREGNRVGLAYLAGADPADTDRIAAGLRASTAAR